MLNEIFYKEKKNGGYKKSWIGQGQDNYGAGK